jgi:uncharacterized metal-binding protein
MEVHKQAALLCAAAIFCRVERATDNMKKPSTLVVIKTCKTGGATGRISAKGMYV